MRRVIDQIGSKYGWGKVHAPGEWWHVDYLGGWAFPILGSTAARGSAPDPDALRREFIAFRADQRIAAALVLTLLWSLKLDRVTLRERPRALWQLLRCSMHRWHSPLRPTIP
jgi:hypothetical protein